MSDVTIYTNRVEPAWSPEWVDTRGLGGSEEAVTLLAREIAAAGHGVTVYASIPGDGVTVDGVRYKRRELYDPLQVRDVLISWKDHWPWAFPRRARVAIHWTADAETKRAWPVAHRARVDAVVALSAYHAERLSFLGDKVRAIPLGVPARYVNGQPATQRDNVAIYTGSPDRGLEATLNLWPLLAARLGCRQLVVTYPVAQPPPQGLLPAGVVWAGAMPVQNWDALVSAARWWLHPLQDGGGRPLPDSEMFSLNAVKVQARGCIPVVPGAMVGGSGLRDTVRTYVDWRQLLQTGDLTVRTNTAARADLPLTWSRVYREFWEPLFRGDVEPQMPAAAGGGAQ